MPTAACDSGEVAKLKGFGAKTQEKILEGLAFLSQMGERLRLDQALPLAEKLLATLKKLPGVIRIELCGSLRRRRETIKDVDLLISSHDAAPIMDAFVKMPEVQQVTGHGETKSSIVAAGKDDQGKAAFLDQRRRLRVVKRRAASPSP